MKKQVLIMNEKDNVAIIVKPISKGETVNLPDGSLVVALDKIPASHKICICNIPAYDPIIRYGDPIGYATREIEPGEWVHVHNLDAYEIME